MGTAKELVGITEPESTREALANLLQVDAEQLAEITSGASETLCCMYLGGCWARRRRP
jgi:hypothetical protein